MNLWRRFTNWLVCLRRTDACTPVTDDSNLRYLDQERERLTRLVDQYEAQRQVERELRRR